MLTKIIIKNYKVFPSFSLEFNSGTNILVGRNEVGKSTLLEAINLALTKRLNGRTLESELSPYLFNKHISEEYLQSIDAGTPLEPPGICIELFFSDNPELAPLRGSMNSIKEDAIGVRLEIAFNEEYRNEYTSLITPGSKPKTIPIEYYKVNWFSFADHALTSRSLPINTSYIDTSTIRLQSGTDHYLQDIIRSDLEVKERAALSIEYRRLKELFAEQPAIKEINKNLTSKTGTISQKSLAISIDISQRTNWEGNLVPHLDDLPFQLVGKGEQNALKIMLALEGKGSNSDVVLIEEPENHLSFTSMNILLSQMREKCKDKQLFIATHSAYVLNKLGLSSLILLAFSGKTVRLAGLTESTQDYFAKLPGYDTLRLVLARRAILVEGPSDELIVQRAYLDQHGKLPIENGVDVISVGTAFLRFLEIAKALDIDVTVVTDNDGNFAKVDKKYKAYEGQPRIKICRSKENSLPTLEPHMVNANGLTSLNGLFSTTFFTQQDLVDYMTENKTDCALTQFNAPSLKYPQYVLDAVSKQ